LLDTRQCIWSLPNPRGAPISTVPGFGCSLAEVVASASGGHPIATAKSAALAHHFPRIEAPFRSRLCPEMYRKHGRAD
jgi:hypothetical protein